jgi:hypothetical protein
MFSDDWQWWFTEEIWRRSTQKVITCFVLSLYRRLLPIWLTLELYALAYIRKPPLTEDHTHNRSCDTEKNTHQEAASHRRPHAQPKLRHWEEHTSGSRLSPKTTRTTGAVTLRRTHIRKPPLTEDHTHNWSCDTDKNKNVWLRDDVYPSINMSVHRSAPCYDMLDISPWVIT